MTNRRCSLAVMLAVAICTGAVAQDAEQEKPTELEVKGKGSQTFYANSRAGNSQVTFFSESALEDFTGVCNRIGGQCTVDPQHIESFAGKFYLRFKDLDTGIDLRNQHMLEPDWFDAAKYPEVVIEIKGVNGVEKMRPNEASMVMIGTCTLRGVTRDVRFPGKLVYLDESPQTMRRVKGDLVRLRANFEIRLSDFGIKGPPGSDIIGLKVADKLEIRVTVFGSTEIPPETFKADSGAVEKTGKVRVPERPRLKRPGSQD